MNKKLTLKHLKADGACLEGLAWIEPLLEHGGPTQGESAIAKSADWVHLYARDVVKGPWTLGEAAS